MYLPNFGLLGQIQLRSWHLTSCCWDITNNKDASPEENNFSSRICICICTKADLGAKLMAKVQLSFTSKLLLLLPNSCSFFSTSGSSADL